MSIGLRRFLLAFSLACLCIIGTFIGGSSWNEAHAQITSDNMQVVITVDVTASTHCSRTIQGWSSVSHKLVITQHTQCSAGTVIQTEVVPLTQAKRQRETYVALLPPNSSSNAQAQWNKQVDELTATKRSGLQSLAVRTNTTCYGNIDFEAEDSATFTYSSLPISFNTWYHTSSTCANIVFEHVEVRGYGSGTGPAYWVKDQYAGITWGCPVVPNYLDSANLNFYPISGRPNPLTQPDGYANVVYLATGNPCVGDNGNLSQHFGETLTGRF